MSICPKSEIHSIYVDNELPEPYKTKFANHLADCKKCTDIVEKYEKIHSLLDNYQTDRYTTQEALDESFQRLQSRMKYNRITRKANNIYDFSSFKYTIPAIAAACVLALILPLRITKEVKQNQMMNEISNLKTAVQTALIHEKGIITNGNIAHGTLASLLGSTSPVNSYNVNNNTNNDNIVTIDLQLPGISDIDIFRPDLENNSVRINITLSSVSDLILPVQERAGVTP